jgi:hypothetical protein
VLLSEGKGGYEDGLWTKLPGGAACGVAADYNGDGKPDVALNTPTGVAILLGTGIAATPFTTGATMTLADTGCLLTGDLNGDGIPDLLVTTPTALVAYLGNGDGTFTESSSTPVRSGVCGAGRLQPRWQAGLRHFRRPVGAGQRRRHVPVTAAHRFESTIWRDTPTSPSAISTTMAGRTWCAPTVPFRPPACTCCSMISRGSSTWSLRLLAGNRPRQFWPT